MDHLVPRIQEYYHESGKPKTTKITNFAMPAEIKKSIGPIPEKGAT